MKRPGLPLATLLTLLLTGLVLAQAGWLGNRSCHAASRRRAELSSQARANDPFTSQAALRYRQCQPSHWRACLLQH